MARAKKSLRETVQKDYPEFAATVDGMSVPDLEGKLAEYAKHAEANEDAKEADEEFQDAKALAAELGAPYRDAKKSIRQKSRYIILLIKEKGGNA